MCTGLKPLLNEDIFRLSPSQPHSPTQSSNHHQRPGAAKNNTSLTICRSKTPSPQPPPTSPHSEPRHTSSPSRDDTSSPQIVSNWMCPTCSFQNHCDSPRPALAKCVQCGTEKVIVSDVEKRRTSEDLHNDMNDQLKALSLEQTGDRNEIVGSDPDLRAAAACRSVSRTASPIGSASNLSGSRHNLSTDGGKWTCSVS